MIWPRAIGHACSSAGFARAIAGDARRGPLRPPSKKAHGAQGVEVTSDRIVHAHDLAARDRTCMFERGLRPRNRWGCSKGAVEAPFEESTRRTRSRSDE